MNLHLDIDLDSMTSFSGQAANSGPAPLGNAASMGDASMDSWPWWVHGTARKMTQVVIDQGYSILIAVRTHSEVPAKGNKSGIQALEKISTDEHTGVPRPSHFLEASQRLITMLNRKEGPAIATEPGLKEPALWVSRLCQTDADMTGVEIRLNSSLVGRRVSDRIQQVLWMAQRHHSHRNFREAQNCFDRARKRVAGNKHDYVLQLGLYRLIESLQNATDEPKPSPWEVRDLAEVYVERELGHHQFNPLDRSGGAEFQESLQWLSSTGWADLGDEN